MKTILGEKKTYNKARATFRQNFRGKKIRASQLWTNRAQQKQHARLCSEEI